MPTKDCRFWKIDLLQKKGFGSFIRLFLGYVVVLDVQDPQ